MHLMLHLHFLIPDPSSFPSGGNLYNHHLMKALAEAGVHVSHSAFRHDLTPSSPDVLYVLDSIFFGNITQPGKQLPQKRIGLIHHLESLFPQSEEVFFRKEKHLLDHFDAFLVSSTFTQRYLQEYGYPKERILVIEPAPLISQHRTTPLTDKVHALLLGSVIPRKGQLEFLKAITASDVPPYYTLTIAGSLTADAVYAHACRSLVLTHPVLTKCVRLTGEQDPDTMRSLYTKSNLFISSSFMETYGMAIQDAVASQLPVLVMEGGNAGEHVVSDAHGARSQSIESLVETFKRCVTDRDFFMKIQQGARDLPPSYMTWEEGARRLIDAYPDLGGGESQ